MDASYMDDDIVEVPPNTGMMAMIAGILSLVFTFSGCGLLAPIAGIIGIVMGRKAMKSEEQKGMGTAGLITGIIGTLISVVQIVFATIIVVLYFSVIVAALASGM